MSKSRRSIDGSCTSARSWLGLLTRPRHLGLLVMPVEWGIWPSSENWHLYKVIRGAAGDTSELHEMPRHCLEASERELALDFLQLFLSFSWRFYLSAYRRSELLFVSHDGYARFWSSERSGEILQRLIDEGLIDRSRAS